MTNLSGCDRRLESIQKQREQLQQQVTEAEATLAALQAESIDLDKLEHQLSLEILAEAFIGDPDKAAAIGREVVRRMLAEALIDRDMSSSFIGNITAIVNDDRKRSDPIATPFSDEERAVISTIEALTPLQFNSLVYLWRASPQRIFAKHLHEATGVSYKSVEGILTKLESLRFVKKRHDWDSGTKRYRYFYSISKIITDRIMFSFDLVKD